MEEKRMKVTVINGVSYKGCNYQMKEIFLNSLREKVGKIELTEYSLPIDCPVFCTGCKACFSKDISVCPHKKYTMPIWDSLLNADLLVFTSPVYVFGLTGQMKALLDHYGSKWMAHSPESPMFSKPAVIITNAAGMGLKNVVKNIGTSLDFWGVARTYTLKQALFMGEWEDIPEKTKDKIKKKSQKLARKLARKKNVKPRLTIKLRFYIMRFAQKMTHKTLIKQGYPETKDHIYWQEKGYLSGKKPWN